MVAALAAAPGFLHRMEMPRAQAWAVVWGVWGMLCPGVGGAVVHELPLACVFTWLYNAFPALLGIAVCFVLAERMRNGRWSLRPLSHASAGVALGLVVNTYFPSNLRFMFHHYGDRVWISEAVAVGSEWHSFALAEWLGWVGLLALLAGAGALLHRRRERWSVEDLATSLAALLFLVMLRHSSRFIEYFVPFAAVALALRWHESVDGWVRSWKPRRRAWLAAALAVWLGVTTVIAALQLRSRPPADLYRGASTWIRNHALPRGRHDASSC
jgi:hypothetical protein